MENLERAITEAVSKEICLGNSADLFSALRILVEHLTNILPGMRVVFFFPETTNLKPVTVYGTPPEVGKKVFVKPYERCPEDSRQRYHEYMDWTVLDVTYSIHVTTNIKDFLTLEMHGKQSNTYEAQVQLGKRRRWDEAYPRKKE